jgi:EAL and modified HD-GYP domain-containing signal transduction protein
MEHVYLGRQPILDDKSAISAYEVLYRDDHMEAHINNDRHASASVISNVLNKFGTASLLGNRRAFVKVDIKFLLHDIIWSIPKEFFVFALFENIELNERVVERLQQLHEKGYKLAINDVTLAENKMQEYEKVFKELSYVKVNIDKEPDATIKAMITKLKANDIKVIGAKIEDNSHYELAKELGCDLFQGYFFAKPNIMENAKYEPGQLNVLKLYNLLISDTNIDEITAEFENNYEITVQLLRFINSCSFHFKNRISSIHHILTLVGRQPLSRWLMLMIYSKSVSKTSKHSPLMLLVKSRTELMENILKAVKPDAKSNILGEACFIGVLSLLDTLFSVELERILKDLNVSEEVTNALLGYEEGLLSDIYTLVIDIEEFDVKAVENFSKKYRLDPLKLKQIILQSIEDVNSFEDSMSA